MPNSKTIKHNGVMYTWNTDKQCFEIVTVETTPIAFEECPKEVVFEFLNLGVSKDA